MQRYSHYSRGSTKIQYFAVYISANLSHRFPVFLHDFLQKGKGLTRTRANPIGKRLSAQGICQLLQFRFALLVQRGENGHNWCNNGEILALF